MLFSSKEGTSNRKNVWRSRKGWYPWQSNPFLIMSAVNSKSADSFFSLIALGSWLCLLVAKISVDILSRASLGTDSWTGCWLAISFIAYRALLFFMICSRCRPNLLRTNCCMLWVVDSLSSSIFFKSLSLMTEKGDFWGSSIVKREEIATMEWNDNENPLLASSCCCALPRRNCQQLNEDHQGVFFKVTPNLAIHCFFCSSFFSTFNNLQPRIKSSSFLLLFQLNEENLTYSTSHLSFILVSTHTELIWF